MKSNMLFVGAMTLFAAVIAVQASAANPVPLINQPLLPDAMKPGSAGFTLTVNGTGFVSGAVVHWNGSARTTAFVSRSRLTASILSSDIAKPSTARVTVVNPGPGGGTSNVVFFNVTVPTSSVLLTSPSMFAAGFGPGSVAIDSMTMSAPAPE
jgi:IPT/TIG domain